MSEERILTRNEILEEAEQIFLRFMAQGWPSGAEPLLLEDKTGFLFKQGAFTFLDQWEVNESSGHSADTITIYYQGQLIWFMSYGGYYPKEASTLVKQALLEVYQRYQFVGGRGPTHYASGHLEYFNQVDPMFQGFKCFSGRDRVIDRSQPSNPEIGWHKYMGIALI